MSDESNVLDQLVSRVDDDTLRTRLAREIELLRGSRRFGLVFDRHLPESVRLPDHPIRKGIRVALRDESSSETWIVDRFADRTREVAVLGRDGGDRHISELIVVREFGEPIYPGLRSVERIGQGPADAPWHVVINGENFHALQALRSTHRGKVDLIYIDPPYNTGNDGWIYNDRYVDQNDRAKSSKWLSFMERRLLIARDLLKPTGVIIAAIGDDEHHRLRMLLDQVFGSDNFLINAVWQGGGSSLSRFHAGGIDYMLGYAQNLSALTAEGIQWRVEKDGLQDILDAAAEAWEESGHDSDGASRRLSKWWSRNKSKYDPGLGDNVKVDDDGTAIKVGDLGNSLHRPNLKYPISDPVTGAVYDPPDNGWRFKREVMEEMITGGRVLFGTRPRLKTPLAEMSMRSVVPSFYKDRRSASQHVAKVLGRKDFPYPKDIDVLARWISIATAYRSDAVVLDFFGGSGSTTEAVMHLNSRDGGSRQSILITNNEISATEAKKLRKEGLRPGDAEWEGRGVFHHVCRPRISTVVTGKRPDGSVYSEGLSANVEMFDLTYLDPRAVRRGHEFESVAPLMWLEGGACGPRIDEVPAEGWAITDVYGVLFDIDVLTAFSDAVADAAIVGTPPAVVFVITDSEAEYQQAIGRLPVGIDTVQLYEDYLSNYTINITGGAR